MDMLEDVLPEVPTIGKTLDNILGEKYFSVDLASEIFEWFGIGEEIERNSKYFERVNWNALLKGTREKSIEELKKLKEKLLSLRSNITTMNRSNIKRAVVSQLNDIENKNYKEIVDIAKKVIDLLKYHCSNKRNLQKKYCKDLTEIRKICSQFSENFDKEVSKNGSNLLNLLDEVMELSKDTWMYYDLAITTGLILYLRDLFVKEKNGTYVITQLGKNIYKFFSNTLRDPTKYRREINLLKRILLYISADPNAALSINVGIYRMEKAIEVGLLKKGNILESITKKLEEKIGIRKVIDYWNRKLATFVKDTQIKYTEGMIVETLEALIKESTEESSLIAQLTIETGQIRTILSIVYDFLKYLRDKLNEKITELEEEEKEINGYLKKGKDEVLKELLSEREKLLRFKGNILDINYGNWKTRLLLTLLGEEYGKAEVEEYIGGKPISIKREGNKIIVSQKRFNRIYEEEYEVRIPYIGFEKFLKKTLEDIRNKIEEIRDLKEKIHQVYLPTMEKILEPLYLFEGEEFFNRITKTYRNTIGEIINLLKQEKERLIFYLKIKNMYEENKFGSRSGDITG